MIRIQNENELLALFRPVDRDEVRPPSHQTYPMAVTDYIAWVEPSGHRTYLIFEDEKSRSGLGVVFKRTQPPPDPVTNMCEWCHSVSGSQTIGMLSASVSQKKRVGLYLCRDLSCKQNILAQPPSVHDLRESLSAHDKTRRMLTRMSDFARRNLF